MSIRRTRRIVTDRTPRDKTPHARWMRNETTKEGKVACQLLWAYQCVGGFSLDHIQMATEWIVTRVDGGLLLTRLHRVCPELAVELIDKDGNPVLLTVSNVKGRGYTIIRDPVTDKPSKRALDVKESCYVNPKLRPLIERVSARIRWVLEEERNVEELLS